MSASFPPADEPAEGLVYDRYGFDGIVVEGMAYGIHIAVFLSCAYCLLQPSARGRMTWPNLAFITTLFALGTVMMVCGVKVREMMFVDNRGFPDGPYVWLAMYGDNLPVHSLSLVAAIVANILADGLLLFRTWMIWNKRWIVIVIPVILWLGYIGTGITMVITTDQDLIFPVTETWIVTVTALNIILTCLIAGRLAAQGRRVGRLLTSDHAAIYTSLSAIVVESSALYTLVGVFYIVSYAVNSPVSNGISLVLNQVMCITPELIVLRIALGKAWSAEHTLPTFVVAPSPTSASASRFSRFSALSPTSPTRSARPLSDWSSHFSSCPSSPRALRTAPPAWRVDVGGRPRTGALDLLTFARAPPGEDDVFSCGYGGGAKGALEPVSEA